MLSGRTGVKEVGVADEHAAGAVAHQDQAVVAGAHFVLAGPGPDLDGEASGAGRHIGGAPPAQTVVPTLHIEVEIVAEPFQQGLRVGTAATETGDIDQERAVPGGGGTGLLWVGGHGKVSLFAATQAVVPFLTIRKSAVPVAVVGARTATTDHPGSVRLGPPLT